MSFLKDFHSEVKMLVIVIIVVVVVSMGVILILKGLSSSTQVKPESQQVSIEAQPTEESTEIDTSNWQTYFSEEFGFEVKYPKDWKISASSEHFILRISNQSSSAHFGVHKRERNSGSISFAVGEWTRELTGDGESAEAIPAAFTFPDDFVVATYGVGSDGLIVDKMLTTFRSLTPEEAKPSGKLPVDEIEDWQTYRNEVFGFEIKYPNNFEKIREEGNSVSFFTPEIGKLNIFITQTNKPLKEVVDKRLGIFAPPMIILKEVQIEIGGKPAIQLEVLYTSRRRDGFETYIDTKESFIVGFQLIDFPDRASVRQLYWKLLSTFRLTEPSNLSDISCSKQIFSGEDIRNLLTPKGKYFLQVTEVPYKNLTNDEFPKFIEDENIRLLLQKIKENADYCLYFFMESVFLGPFDTKEVISRELAIVSSDFPTALLWRNLPNWNLLGIYRTRDGFMLFPVRFADFVEYAVDEDNQRLFVHNPGSFEFERTPGLLRVIDGRKGEVMNLDSISGFALLPNKEEILIARGKIIPGSPHPDARSVEAFISKIDLSTKKETFLELSGGEGGIFVMKNGDIFVSHSFVPPTLSGIEFPYSQFNPETEELVRMSKDFTPDFNQKIQPSYVGSRIGVESGEDFQIIADVGTAKLIRFNKTLFIEGRVAF